MKKIAWLTDLHLNFVTRTHAEQLAQDIRAKSPDAVLIGGDIADAPIVDDRLGLLADILAPVPVYFVLGNHDFYHGSFGGVTTGIHRACGKRKNLFWLNSGGPVYLSDKTVLVGVDGWGDGGYGNKKTRVRLNDSVYIKDLVMATGDMAVFEGLGKTFADLLRWQLGQTHFCNVLVLTHVPPFEESAKYQGKPSEPDFAPFFACKATGDVLREEAAKWPKRNYTVLCGHTHEACEAQILPNLHTITGGAVYRNPVIQRILEVE